MATAPSPNDLTRQQLDELDALLQRMLSVPLTPADTPMPASLPPSSRGSSGAGGPPLPPSWRVDPPTTPAAGASSPHIALPDPPPLSLAQALEAVPPPVAPPPAPTAAKPAAPPPTAPSPAAPPPVPKPVAKAAPAPTPPPVPKPAAAPPKPAASPVAPAPTATSGITPAPAAPPTPLLLLPLVALNALFDGACGMFGMPGRILRSGFFKYLYGLTGVGLLVYTAAHVAQVRGWITLPVTVPWPLPWPR